MADIRSNGVRLRHVCDPVLPSRVAPLDCPASHSTAACSNCPSCAKSIVQLRDLVAHLRQLLGQRRDASALRGQLRLEFGDSRSASTYERRSHLRSRVDHEPLTDRMIELFRGLNGCASP
jgi:hypothetical protein